MASIAITRKPLSVTIAFSQVKPVIVSMYLSAPETFAVELLFRTPENKKRKYDENKVFHNVSFFIFIVKLLQYYKPIKNSN